MIKRGKGSHQGKKKNSCLLRTFYWGSSPDPLFFYPSLSVVILSSSREGRERGLSEKKKREERERKREKERPFVLPLFFSFRLLFLVSFKLGAAELLVPARGRARICFRIRGQEERSSSLEGGRVGEGGDQGRRRVRRGAARERRERRSRSLCGSSRLRSSFFFLSLLLFTLAQKKQLLAFFEKAFYALAASFSPPSPFSLPTSIARHGP